MDLRGKKLGLLLAAPPGHPNFERGLCLAEAALRRGVEVYLYCIDEAVRGVADPRLATLKEHGLRLYACAYGAQRRQVPRTEHALWAGLATVSELITATDRFVSLK